MIQKLKGTRDIIPGEIEIWQYIESKAKNVFDRRASEEAGRDEEAAGGIPKAGRSA